MANTLTYKHRMRTIAQCLHTSMVLSHLDYSHQYTKQNVLPTFIEHNTHTQSHINSYVHNLAHTYLGEDGVFFSSSLADLTVSIFSALQNVCMYSDVNIQCIQKS